MESFGSAAEAIGPISADMAVFAVTRGQWSMIDALTYCIDSLGPGCEISVWTWTVADYEVAAMTGLMNRGDIAGATLLVDMATDKRRPDILAKWRETFGPDSVKVCRSHAKLARVWKGDFKFLLRGSMNLNFNPRFEQFDITGGGDDFDLVAEIENEMPVLPADYSFLDVVMAGKLKRAFDDETMAMFDNTQSLNMADFSPFRFGG